jgi:hypothetical protein
MSIRIIEPRLNAPAPVFTQAVKNINVKVAFHSYSIDVVFCI